jgi:hypothetical protein
MILELHLDLRDASIKDLDRNENITKDLKEIYLSFAGFYSAPLSCGRDIRDEKETVSTQISPPLLQ